MPQCEELSDRLDKTLEITQTIRGLEAVTDMLPYETRKLALPRGHLNKL